MADETGTQTPHGSAIADAIKRGDLHEMEHVADQTRLAIAHGAQQEGVELAESASQAAAKLGAVASHEVGAVRAALTNLEAKISELRQAKRGAETHTERPQPAPRTDPNAPPQT
ncbi:MAG TPA: hypothetical protein VGC96_03965 [Candidatus Elarobacter sp.]|jgi:hypothetical protein